MTDYEKFTELLTSRGISFDPGVDTAYDRKTITLRAQWAKVGGYAGFYAEFSFTYDGELVGVEVAE